MATPDSSGIEGRASEGSAALGPDVASETEALFLARLRQLLERRYQSTESYALEQQRALDRAIYSTFCDCLELGLNGQARALLRQHTDG
jgi:hypothetical protein